ncbi:ABC transporter permease [Dyadobacter subterraneus]|uniref:ABC transporter permease n=1 Tax=Dyadobacter subterraneus TaxID=2773304 RepID=A0ABR9W9T2_9BACT|nr:ABC transporter permease [Dyadobacter subterraneus]MBE9462197.1 ABC transporter permease [Dyadobacter subterraneus]
MLGNYLKISRRNLWKSKGSSAINIFGLAMGIAACFFIFQYVYFESTYDQFHKNAANIYRVPISYPGSESVTPATATNHPAVGPAMKADFPEVADFTRLASVSLFMPAYTLSYKDAKGGEKIYNEDNMYLADASFFNVFSYPLISGDRKTCLTEPNSIVISASTAKKYFGDTDPLGKMLDMNGSMLEKVTGVFKDIPDNSHIKFDMLVSFSSIKPNYGYDDWSRAEFYNYVVLAPGTDVKKLEAKFPAFIEKYLGTRMKELNLRLSFHLQPITDIHLYSNYLKEAEANGSEKEVSLLSIIGIFILFIAWINYINLSTAKSVERAKEVGLRKVVGAEKSQLITQFLTESFIINLFALIVAFAVIFCCTPFFNDFIGKDITTDFFSDGLGGKPIFWFSVLLFFLVGALLVGAYPAFVLSSFLPVRVLKGLKTHPGGGISMRRVLVSFQFILSITLIASTVVIFQQFNFMRNGKLGYQKDQVVIVKTPVVKGEAMFNALHFFKNEILNINSVKDATATTDIPGHMIRFRKSVRRVNQDKRHNFETYLMEIDQNFVPTYQIELIAGKNLIGSDSSKLDSTGSTKVLINEELAKMLGYKSPEEAINQEIVFTWGDDVNCKIGGVMKNFHQRSLKEKFDPILCYSPSINDWRYLSIKLNAKNAAQSLSQVEKLYHKTFPGSPFEYFFLDEYFNRQYEADSQLSNIFILFSMLAIIIACLGLLGLSSFVIKLRTKEIGIRKVLRASVVGLLILVSKDFIKMVCVASAISTPVIYYLSNAWLKNYAFHITPGISVFIIPPVLLLTLTLIIICTQSLKTTLTNPVKSLSNE